MLPVYVQPDLSNRLCPTGFVQPVMSNRISPTGYVQPDLSNRKCPTGFVIPAHYQLCIIIVIDWSAILIRSNQICYTNSVRPILSNQICHTGSVQLNLSNQICSTVFELKVACRAILSDQ